MWHVKQKTVANKGHSTFRSWPILYNSGKLAWNDFEMGKVKRNFLFQTEEMAEICKCQFLNLIIGYLERSYFVIMYVRTNPIYHVSHPTSKWPLETNFRKVDYNRMARKCKNNDYFCYADHFLMPDLWKYDKHIIYWHKCINNLMYKIWTNSFSWLSLSYLQKMANIDTFPKDNRLRYSRLDIMVYIAAPPQMKMWVDKSEGSAICIVELIFNSTFIKQKKQEAGLIFLYKFGFPCLINRLSSTYLWLWIWIKSTKPWTDADAMFGIHWIIVIS